MTAKHLVSDVLDALAQRLDPVIAHGLADELKGLTWTVILTELDKSKGYPPKAYTRSDLQAQLRMLTERLGGLQYPFDDQARTVSTLGGELRIVRNDFAHGGDFSWTDAWRAGDFALRLLDHLGDDEGATECAELRDQAYAGMGREAGIVAAAEAESRRDTPSVVNEISPEDFTPRGDTSAVEPPEEAFHQDRIATTATAVGVKRAAFEPWKQVIAGPQTVIEELPKKSAKMRLRAVAAEIADFEGPVEIERLARLTASAFGWKRLASKRIRQIAHQIRQTDGLDVDGFGFVWPAEIDADSWTEFRPQAGTAQRQFEQISPHEISNAAAFVRARSPEIDGGDFERAVVEIFGRSKLTKSARVHLTTALALPGRSGA